jgi:PAS domain S-box-containing protein
LPDLRSTAATAARNGAIREPSRHPSGAPGGLDGFWQLATDLFAIADGDGLLYALNPAWERTLGWSCAQLGSRPLTAFVHPDDLEATVAVLARTGEAGTRLDDLENRWRRRDGSYCTLSWSGSSDGDVWCVVGRDVTGRSRERTLLREAQRIAELTNWEWDLGTDRVTTAFVAQRLTGGAPVAPFGLTGILARVGPEDRDAVRDGLFALRAGTQGEARMEHRVVAPGGQVRWLDTRCRVLRDAEGAPCAVRGTSQDITERVEARERLRDAADFWQGTMDSLEAHVAVIDGDGTIVAANRAWRSFGAGGDVRNGEVGDDYLAPPGARAGVQAVLDGDAGFAIEFAYPGAGEARRFALHATRFSGSGPVSVVIAHHDITAAVAAERSVTDARNHLAAVTDSMGEGLIALDREGCVTLVNQAAERLLGWPGDLLHGQPMHGLADSAVRQALERGATIRVEDEVFMRRDATELPTSYTAAPLVTADGLEGCVVVFTDATARQAEQRELRRKLDALSWAGRVQDALREERFVLYAQPILDLATGRVTQHELLLRVREPDGSIAGPGAYLQIAEEHGLIGAIDRWVVTQAAGLAARGLPVELNVSGASIGDPALLSHIETCLRDSGADPALLVFEITETALIGDEEAGRRFAQRVRALGCRLALDDFGTGYGGFTYLKQIPVDYLKIDIEFVRDLRTSTASLHVVEAVVNLARGFGLKTVAEGVEDAETLTLLEALGVDYAQGYHIARPGPLDDVLFTDPVRSTTA